MKTVKKGDGMTARLEIELAADEWQPIFDLSDHLGERLGRPPDVFDWSADAAVEWAEDTLQGHRGQPETDSRQDFAIRIIRAAVKARDAIERGKAADAAHHALALGRLIAAVEIKFPHEAIWNFGVDTQKERKDGGLNSHGLTEENRKQRNEIIQDEVDRLCLESRLSYKEACRRVGERVTKLCKAAGLADENIKKLSQGRIKTITTNPHHTLTK